MNTQRDEKIKFKFSPEAPKNIDQLDIPQSIVEDIILRHLYTKSSSSLKSLCNSLKLAYEKPSYSKFHQELASLQQFIVTICMTSDVSLGTGTT